MLCNKAWSDAFLVQHLKASFVRTDYRTYRKELLTQQQISRLPTTMAAAETYKQVKVLERKINELAAENKEASKNVSQKDGARVKAVRDCTAYNSYPSIVEQIDVTWTPDTVADNYIKIHVLVNVKRNIGELDGVMKALKQRYLELTGVEFLFTDADASAVFNKMVRLEGEKTQAKKEWNEAHAVKSIIMDTIRKVQHDIILLKNGGNVAGLETRDAARNFIMPCSNGDCRGFLSSQYKCGICDYHTCAKCFDLIGLSKTPKEGTTGHVCKPENVESADLIRKQTKPCPCCGTRISKIDGCDQMWCTQCHKAFSWNTGKIVTGVIHNPHFYQFQREQGEGGVAPRNPGDVPCGGLPDLHIVQQTLRRKLGGLMQSPPVLALLEIHRLQHHFNHVYINHLRVKVAAEQDNEEERVLFIVNEITREELATRVMRKDGARKKNTAILYVCDLFTTVAIDLFRAIVVSDVAAGEPCLLEVSRLCTEYENLRQYCMEQFKTISVTYGVCVPSINPKWEFTTAKFNANGDMAKYVERREEQKKQREAKEEERREKEMMELTLRRLDRINLLAQHQRATQVVA